MWIRCLSADYTSPADYGYGPSSTGESSYTPPPPPTKAEQEAYGKKQLVDLGGKIKDGANGGGTNWGTYITGAILTAEDVYNNFGHNHTTYTTTKGVVKNIYKSNGAVRSARAGQFATASKVVKWTGIAGTAFMTGVATYNIVNDVSNNRSVSGWDIADGSVGAVGLTGAGLSSVGIISNPVGWGIGAGVAIYGWGRLWFDLGAKYGPSKWYGTNDNKWFE